MWRRRRRNIYLFIYEKNTHTHTHSLLGPSKRAAYNLSKQINPSNPLGILLKDLHPWNDNSSKAFIVHIPKGNSLRALQFAMSNIFTQNNSSNPFGIASGKICFHGMIILQSLESAYSKEIHPRPHNFSCIISSNKSNTRTLQIISSKMGIQWNILPPKPWERIFRKGAHLGSRSPTYIMSLNKPMPPTLPVFSVTYLYRWKYSSSKALRVHIPKGNSSRAS